MNSNLRRYLAQFLVILCSFGVCLRICNAQDCDNLFVRVEYLFDDKNYDEIIQQTYACLGQLERDDKIRANEVLAQAHLYRNEIDSAKKRIRHIIEKLDGDYKPEPTRAYHPRYTSLFKEVSAEYALTPVRKNEFEILGMRFQKRWGYLAMAAVGAGVGVAILAHGSETQPLPFPPDLREMP